MNWTEIKEKYPKAWDKLFEMFDEGVLENEIVFDNEPSYISDIIRFEKNVPLLFGRLLYDFFDEQGVYVEIFRAFSYTNKLQYWDWGVGNDDHFNAITGEVEEPTRTEAEGKAFEKAFKILEGEL